jgi:hypothetical protein
MDTEKLQVEVHAEGLDLSVRSNEVRGTSSKSWGCNGAARPTCRLPGPVGQTLDDAVEHEEERGLQQHRQAATERIDALFLVELHHLFVQELTVLRSLVLLLELLDLRLQLLHCHHRLRALDGEGGETP